MRKLGIAILGFIGGLFAGLMLTEVVSRIILGISGTFPDSLPLALALGCLTPVLAVAGVPAALAIDSRRPHHNELS